MRPIVAAIIVSLSLSAVVGAQDHEVAFKAIESGNVSGLKAMLARNPAIAKSKNSNGLDLATRAAMETCVGCMAALLDAGVSPNHVESGSMGRSLLHMAAGWSTQEMVALLVSRGANVNARTKRGDSVLSFANNNFLKDSTAEREKIVRFLRSKSAT